MEAAQARLSLHLSKCHIVGNHMSWLILFEKIHIKSQVQDSDNCKTILTLFSTRDILCLLL